MALSRLGVKWTKLNTDNSIPSDVLAQCVGKRIVRLQFPYKRDDTGKPKYTNFSELFLATTPNAKEKLVEAYNKSVSGGYVKPLADESTEFPTPAVPTAESSVI